MTADEPRLRVTTNLAFGICLILIGGALILDRLQLVDASQILQYWPAGLILFGAALVIQSFQRDTGLAGQQNVRPGHIVAFVILAVLLSQGLPRGVTTRTDSSETAVVVAVLGRHQQVSTAAVFRGAAMTSIMGRADLDLRQTNVAAGDDAVIDVFTLMGGTTLRVPQEWTVDVRATPVAGGVRDRRGGVRGAAGAPRIVVRGFIMFGGLDIRE